MGKRQIFAIDESMAGADDTTPLLRRSRKAAYLRLSQRIFNPKRHHANLPGQAKDFLLADGRFDSKELEDAIKDTITDRGLPENALLKDPASPCKVYVCLFH